MDKRPSYIILKKFTQSLLENVVNSGKTSDIALNISFEDLKKNMTEQNQYLDFLREEYIKKHDIPRKESEFAYSTYVTDKMNLKNEWKRSKDISKLMDFLQFKLPEDVILVKDPIYTSYS
jgi:hypothetical protein